MKTPLFKPLKSLVTRRFVACSFFVESFQPISVSSGLWRQEARYWTALVKYQSVAIDPHYPFQSIGFRLEHFLHKQVEQEGRFIPEIVYDGIANDVHFGAMNQTVKEMRLKCFLVMSLLGSKVRSCQTYTCSSRGKRRMLAARDMFCDRVMYKLLADLRHTLTVSMRDEVRCSKWALYAGEVKSLLVTSWVHDEIQLGRETDYTCCDEDLET
jgi:hypothetical protein